MASKRGSNSPPPIEVKLFTVEEIDRGIAKLRRRIEEVSALQKGVRYDDARIRTAEINLRETIREVFGGGSPEFDYHKHHNIHKGGWGLYDTEQDHQRKNSLKVPQTPT